MVALGYLVEPKRSGDAVLQLTTVAILLRIGRSAVPEPTQDASVQAAYFEATPRTWRLNALTAVALAGVARHVFRLTPSLPFPHS